MAVQKLTGELIIEQMRSSIMPITESYLAKLAGEEYGEYKAKGLRQAIEDGSEMGIIAQLPGRTFGDRLWKHSIQDALAGAGHKIILDDTRDHDSIDCGTPREYKASRILSVAGRPRVVSSNPTRRGNVTVELFIADGATLEESGFYALKKSTLDRFSRSYRNGTGWSLNLSAADVKDPEGLGQFRMDAEEYARYRTGKCRCK